MTTTETWWETIFEGDLSMGLNKERIADLEGETFLYFNDGNVIPEHENMTH